MSKKNNNGTVEVAKATNTVTISGEELSMYEKFLAQQASVKSENVAPTPPKRGKRGNSAPQTGKIAFFTNFNVLKDKIGSFYVVCDSSIPCVEDYIKSKPTMLPTNCKVHKGLGGKMGYWFGQSHMENVALALKKAGFTVETSKNPNAK